MTHRGAMLVFLTASVSNATLAVAAERRVDCGGVALQGVSSTNYIHRADDLVVDCATLLTPDYKCSVRRRDAAGEWHYGEATHADVCEALTAAATALKKK